MGRKKIPADTRTFKYINVNPANKITTDCVIRALSLALDMDWHDLYRDLFEFSDNISMMLNDPKCYPKYLEANGWKKMPAPRKDDNRRYTGDDFCINYLREHKIKSPIIAHIGGHHVVCIKDGKVHDTWDSTDGSIGNYWIKE